MSKKNMLAIVVWTLAFALSVFVLLVIPSQYTSSIFITLIFDVVTFISTLIFWLTLYSSNKKSKDMFYRSPAMIISAFYLFIQFILCIVVGALGERIAFKVALTINFILFVIMWAIILSTLIANDHAIHVDSRQKDHHKVIK